MRNGFNSLAERLDDRFDGLMDRMAEIRVGNAETASSVAAAWKELTRVRDKVDELPGETDEKLVEHKNACAIGDITRTEVRLKRERVRDRGRELEREAETEEGFDTPARGTRRRESLAPRGHFFKIPVPKLLIYLAIAIGVAVAAGGWAWGLFVDRELGTVRQYLSGSQQ
jgi:hypothetical protein